MTAPAWGELGFGLPDGGTYLSAEASVLVARYLDALSRMQHLRLPPAGREIRAALVYGNSRAGVGHSDVRPQRVSSQSSPWVSADWVSTADVAERLSVGQRQACRLVKDGELGEARKLKNQWRVRRAELEAAAKARESR